VFRFRKMVYGNIFRKPFSVFSFGILRSNENIFSLTSVLHCTKRLQMLKTFSAETNGALEIEFNKELV
jgi:hypothetical protein